MGALNVEYTASAPPTTERVEVWVRNAYDFVWQMLAEKAAVLHEFINVAGLREGVPCEVATRFKRGGLAAAPYSSADASTWPAASKSSGTPALPAVTALTVTRAGNHLTLQYTGGVVGGWLNAKFEKNINSAGWSTISDAQALTNSVGYDLVGSEQSGSGLFRVSLYTGWVFGAAFTTGVVDLGFPVPISLGWTRSCHSNAPDPGQTPMYHITATPNDITSAQRIEVREGTLQPYVFWRNVPAGSNDGGDYLAETYSGTQKIQMRSRHENGANISDWRYSAEQQIGSCP